MTPIERKARELLPCPFCGASGISIGLKSMLSDRCWRVQCVCGAEGGPFSPIRDDEPWGPAEEAIAAWNRRAALTPPVGGLPELPAPVLLGLRGLPVDVELSASESMILGYTAAQLHAYALEAIAASRVGDGLVLVSKAELQRALEGIKVPKMSPVKQECFKAGTHAVIRAFNAALFPDHEPEAAPQVALNRGGSKEA